MKIKPIIDWLNFFITSFYGYYLPSSYETEGVLKFFQKLFVLAYLVTPNMSKT